MIAPEDRPGGASREPKRYRLLIECDESGGHENVTNFPDFGRGPDTLHRFSQRSAWRSTVFLRFAHTGSLNWALVWDAAVPGAKSPLRAIRSSFRNLRSARLRLASARRS